MPKGVLAVVAHRDGEQVPGRIGDDALPLPVAFELLSDDGGHRAGEIDAVGGAARVAQAEEVTEGAGPIGSGDLLVVVGQREPERVLDHAPVNGRRIRRGRAELPELIKRRRHGRSPWR